MDKIKKNLNTIGLGLIVLAVVALRILPSAKILAIALAVLGIAAIGLYIVLNLGQLKTGLARRSFLYSSNALLVIVLVLGIIVLLNMFFSRHHHRFDFTEAKLHSLSDQSIKVAQGLKSDLTVKGFFREGNPGRNRMEDLLRIYAYQSPKIKYEFIDPDKNPGLVKRYEVTQDGTTILESGARDTRITAVTEEDVTNAIIKVTRETKKTVYFLAGHGEHDSEDSQESGMSFAKDDLVKQGYEVKKQSLALGQGFPADCALLVIPGPEKDFVLNEYDTVKKYVESGGRVLFMIDPQTAPGTAAYLAQFGFKLEDDLIIEADTLSRMMGADYFMPIAREYESHEITRNFRFATFFPYARSVGLIDPKPDGVLTSQGLAKTSANSWAEHDLVTKKVTYDKLKDKIGPIILAAVATIKAKADPAAAAAPPSTQKDGRVAVIGDSDFASNRYFNMGGNGNFFLNVANWLTEEADLISIQPKTQNPRSLQLTQAQGRTIFWVSVILLPLAVLAFGISVWMRRRAY
jgi:ABC-type uncharacterized transport system involved in gliding motility auxiliary subunit